MYATPTYLLIAAALLLGACEKQEQPPSQAGQGDSTFRRAPTDYVIANEQGARRPSHSDVVIEEAVPIDPTPSEQTVMLDSVEHRYFPTCGDQRFDITPRYIGRVYEVRNLVLTRSTIAPTEADRLNGVEWLAQIRYSYSVGRAINGNPNTQWQDTSDWFHNSDNHIVRLRKINGHYETKVTTWPWAPFPDFKSDEEQWFSCVMA